MKTLINLLSLCLVVLGISMGSHPEAVADQNQGAIDAAVELRSRFLPFLGIKETPAAPANQLPLGNTLASVKILAPADRVYTKGWEGAEIPTVPGFADMKCQEMALKEIGVFQKFLAAKNKGKSTSKVEFQLVHIFEHPVLKYSASCASPSNKLHFVVGQDRTEYLCLGLLAEEESLALPVATNGNIIVRAVSIVSGLTNTTTGKVAWINHCVIPTSEDILHVYEGSYQQPWIRRVTNHITKLTLGTGAVSVPQPPSTPETRIVP